MENLKIIAGSVAVAYVLLIFPTCLTLSLFDVYLPVKTLQWVTLIPSLPVGYLISKIIK